MAVGFRGAVGQGHGLPGQRQGQPLPGRQGDRSRAAMSPADAVAVRACGDQEAPAAGRRRVGPGGQASGAVVIPALTRARTAAEFQGTASVQVGAQVVPGARGARWRDLGWWWAAAWGQGGVPWAAWRWRSRWWPGRPGRDGSGGGWRMAQGGRRKGSQSQGRRGGSQGQGGRERRGWARAPGVEARGALTRAARGLEVKPCGPRGEAPGGRGASSRQGARG